MGRIRNVFTCIGKKEEKQESKRELESLRNANYRLKTVLDETQQRLSQETKKSIERAAKDFRLYREKFDNAREAFDRLKEEKDRLSEILEETRLQGRGSGDINCQPGTSDHSIELLPPVIRQKLTRLELENQKLKEDLKVAVDANPSEEGARVLVEQLRKHEAELEENFLKKEQQMIEMQNAYEDKIRRLQSQNMAKDEELKKKELQYNKCMEKAKSVIVTLEPTSVEPQLDFFNRLPNTLASVNSPSGHSIAEGSSDKSEIYFDASDDSGYLHNSCLADKTVEQSEIFQDAEADVVDLVEDEDDNNTLEQDDDNDDNISSTNATNNTTTSNNCLETTSSSDAIEEEEEAVAERSTSNNINNIPDNSNTTQHEEEEEQENSFQNNKKQRFGVDDSSSDEDDVVIEEPLAIAVDNNNIVEEEADDDELESINKKRKVVFSDSVNKRRKLNPPSNELVEHINYHYGYEEEEEEQQQEWQRPHINIFQIVNPVVYRDTVIVLYQE